MNPALTIGKKEYSLALRAPATYVVIGIFLIFSGFIFSSTAFKVGLAELRGAFGFMHILMLLFIPAITMGAIARERNSGTLELVSTLPVKLWHIVWGKWLGAFALLKTMLLLTLVYLPLIYLFGTGVDLGAVITGYVGLLFAGGAYIAIGLFASSLSENQVLAFILAMSVSALFYLIGHVGDLVSASLLSRIEFFGFDYHLDSFLKGVVDTRDILYFAVVTFIFAQLTELRLQAQNLEQER